MDLVESRPLCITSGYFPCNWLKLQYVDTTLGYTGVDEKSLMQTLTATNDFNHTTEKAHGAGFSKLYLSGLKFIWRLQFVEITWSQFSVIHLTVMPNFMIQDQKWNSLNFLDSENMRRNFSCI